MNATRLRLIPSRMNTALPPDSPPLDSPFRRSRVQALTDRLQHSLEQEDLWAMTTLPSDDTWLVSHAGSGAEETRVPARTECQAVARFAVHVLGEAADTVRFGARSHDASREDRRWYFDSAAGVLRVRRLPRLSASTVTPAGLAAASEDAA